MPENVKCVECGFYSRLHLASNELACADSAYRNKPSFYINDPSQEFSAVASCAMKVPDFWEEGDFEESVNRKRSCDSFTPWMPIYSPKEHADMIRDATMREWQEAQADKANYRANLSLAVAISGIVIAAAINLAGLLVSGDGPNITVVVPENNAPVQAASP